MCYREELPVLLDALINVEKLNTSKKLHHHGRSHDGGNTELHQGTTDLEKEGKRKKERKKMLIEKKK
jgi:hypothetical protein